MNNTIEYMKRTGMFKCLVNKVKVGCEESEIDSSIIELARDEGFARQFVHDCVEHGTDTIRREIYHEANLTHFKVVCIGRREKNDPCFTLGKIYYWDNGTITDDRGHTFRSMVDGTDVDEWELSRYYDFVRIVE